MPSMSTVLTDLLSIQTPIVQAPMSSAATPALAAAVSNAGGLGMISGTWQEPAALRVLIRNVRSRTARPFAVNLGLEWEQEERIAICLEEGIRIISLFWGDPAQCTRLAQEGGALVLHTVGSADEGAAAVDAGVDAVVAQGWEAGGHLDSKIGNLALIPSVVDAVGSVPVIAAGGIADGRALAHPVSGWEPGSFLAKRPMPMRTISSACLARAGVTPPSPRSSM